MRKPARACARVCWVVTMQAERLHARDTAVAAHLNGPHGARRFDFAVLTSVVT